MPDSFDVIKDLVSKHPEPTREQALEIYPALKDVYDRLMKVRAIAPRVDYSDRLWRLLELAGFPNKCLRKPAFK